MTAPASPVVLMVIPLSQLSERHSHSGRPPSALRMAIPEPPAMFAVEMRNSPGHWMESNDESEPSVRFLDSPPSGETTMTSPESLPRSLQFEVR